MTYDELLAEIIDNLSNCNNECESCKADDAPWVALRAVVELHKPEFVEEMQDLGCWACKNWAPCKTIQVIEKGLE